MDCTSSSFPVGERRRETQNYFAGIDFTSISCVTCRRFLFLFILHEWKCFAIDDGEPFPTEPAPVSAPTTWRILQTSSFIICELVRSLFTHILRAARESFSFLRNPSPLGKITWRIFADLRLKDHEKGFNGRIKVENLMVFGFNLKAGCTNPLNWKIQRIKKCKNLVPT